MEKFLLRGKNKDGVAFHLRLPPAKRFEYLAVKNGETTTHTKLLLSEAVSQSKSQSSHVQPSAMIIGESSFLPRSLQQLLSDHPYPVSQGPVVLPIDMNTHPKRHSGIVLGKKTIFTHDQTQKCATWVPEVSGIAAWTDKNHVYDVCEVGDKIQGAASTRTMGLVYTCHMCTWSGCVIHCPCSICRETKNHCRNRHIQEPCKECSSQCLIHKIKLPRLFNPDTDHFTIVTEKINKYRYATGYAGIPRCCDHCSKDVREHQTLHMVYHTMCRFCRHEMRPVSQSVSVITVKEYEEESDVLRTWDEKTCSFCLNVCKNKLAREKHESVVHLKEPQKFKCNQCDKTYSNSNALRYHMSKLHQVFEKPSCDVCGSQFYSSATLIKHKQKVHQEILKEASYKCDDCGKAFSYLSALKRHEKEQHFGPKFNVDYHEGYKTIAIFECDQCDLKFKRSSDLKRHIQTAHLRKKFMCGLCEKSYSRKDALSRHVKSDHADN